MWKNSISFPQIEVSEDGGIRAWHKSWGRYVEKTSQLDKDGYELIRTRHSDGRTTTARIHRLVAEVYVPNPENKPVVNHKNGIKNDNRAENLGWVTIAENTQHGYDELGVISAQSKKILLLINNTPFSTYNSITLMCKKIGINRNKLEWFESLCDSYFSFKEIPVDFSFPNHNKDVWKNEFRLNTRGRFYCINMEYYDKMSDIMNNYDINRDAFYLGVRKGIIKGSKIEVVSCKEYLENSRYKNW